MNGARGAWQPEGRAHEAKERERQFGDMNKWLWLQKHAPTIPYPAAVQASAKAALHETARNVTWVHDPCR